MRTFDQRVAEVLGGRGRTKVPVANPGPVEGVVHGITAAGMTFTIPTWDDGKHVFGPAPWPMSRTQPIAVGDHGTHDHAETTPVAGDRCLIVFAGTGIERPWCVGWWSA